MIFSDSSLYKRIIAHAAAGADLLGISKLRSWKLAVQNVIHPAENSRHLRHSILSKDLRFDILSCPYAKYTAELGCPEIAHIFCDNDIYAYGSLKGITFERTQTIGTGGSKCDFHLYKTK